ncbi:hypothetical protein HKBW3S42_01769, partial [Candidatus Hakubella thermalkaliphila]
MTPDHFHFRLHYALAYLTAAEFG